MANEEFRPNADLSRRKLEGRDLRNLDLSGADLSGANLKKVDLRKTNLIGADLTAADLSEADLRGANLTKAMLVKVNLSHAFLNEANLDGADLSHAHFWDTLLVGANLCNADLTDPGLLYNLDLRRIIYNNQTIFPMGLELPPSAVLRDEKLPSSDVSRPSPQTVPIHPGVTKAASSFESTRTLLVQYMPDGKDSKTDREITIPVQGRINFQRVYSGPYVHREQTFRKTIESLNGLEKEVLIDAYRLLVDANFTSCNNARGADGLAEASRSGYTPHNTLPGAGRTSGTDNGPGCLACNLLRHKDSGAPGYPILGSIVAALIDDGVWKEIQMREIPT